LQSANSWKNPGLDYRKKTYDSTQLLFFPLATFCAALGLLALIWTASANSAYAQAPLTIDVKTNPQTAEIGDTISTVVSLTNNGTEPIIINGMRIISPTLNPTTLPPFPETLRSGEARGFVLNVEIPREIPGGTYTIIIQMTLLGEE
jgi:hypothetical protein